MKKLNTILKRRNFITFLTVFLVSIYVCTAAVSVSATSRNVTKKYKKTVTNTLSGIGTYLEITSGTGMDFKYDAYAKTTMACLKYGQSRIDGKTEKSVKKAVVPVLKRYFGTSTFKVRKYRQSEANRIASSYICKKGGRLMYLRGDWGLLYPSGRVTKIIQTGSRKFVATFTVNWYDRSYLNRPAKKKNCIGIYKIYLQKKGNHFTITNIKRTYQGY